MKWLICRVWGHAWRFCVVRNHDTGQDRPGRVCTRRGECQ